MAPISTTATAPNLIGLRLTQALAQSGVCSRRAAARLISHGHVRVNGQLQPHHYVVKDEDVILLDGQPLPAPEPLQYWLYHKPVGIDCNLRPQDPNSLVHLLQKLPVRLFPLGRLDKDSSGLLLLSNDGQFSQQLMHADSEQQKEYQVLLDKPLTTLALQKLKAGVQWQTGPHQFHAVPFAVCRTGPQQLHITLTEGMHRQIRYMCRAIGYKVVQLHRFRINQLYLQEPVGTCRLLTAAEFQSLTPTSSS